MDTPVLLSNSSVTAPTPTPPAGKGVKAHPTPSVRREQSAASQEGSLLMCPANGQPLLDEAQRGKGNKKWHGAQPRAISQEEFRAMFKAAVDREVAKQVEAMMCPGTSGDSSRRKRPPASRRKAAAPNASLDAASLDAVSDVSLDGADVGTAVGTAVGAPTKISRNARRKRSQHLREQTYARQYSSNGVVLGLGV